MTRIMVMSETLPLANVKAKFSEMVDRVEHTHDRIIVTRNGRPAAVLISPEELESLEDTLELLSDPEAMRQLGEARHANETGDFITGDECAAATRPRDRIRVRVPAAGDRPRRATTESLAGGDGRRHRRVHARSTAREPGPSRRATPTANLPGCDPLRGSYRIVCEIDERQRLVIVLRIEHRSTAYRPR